MLIIFCMEVGQDHKKPTKKNVKKITFLFHCVRETKWYNVGLKTELQTTSVQTKQIRILIT
jgi:hypothetical protein